MSYSLTDASSITHRKIWQLAGPMILANMSIPILGMVDTAVVGHLDSPAYVGAVAVGTLIFSFLFWGFGFLRMATTGLTAQAVGRAGYDGLETQFILRKTLKLSLVISVVLILCQVPLSHLAFSVIDSSEGVATLGQQYFTIRIWSSPAILANYVTLGWLIGQSDTRAALWLILVVNISNIVLDLLFVSVFSLAVEGVAIASVIAEYLGLVVAYLLIKRRGFSLTKTLPFNTPFKWRTMLKLHSNIFIRTLCLIFCFAFFTAQGAKQGDVTLAANAVLLHFITFMAFFLDGFANAIEAIAGKAIGAGNKHLLKQGFRYAAVWSVAIAVLFSFTYSLFGSEIIRLLTTIPAVIDTAKDYLFWLIIAPLIGVWSYLFDGLFIGAMRSIEMRNTMLISAFLCYFPAWFLLQPYGNDGLWLALLLFLAARGLSQAYYLPRILST